MVMLSNAVIVVTLATEASLPLTIRNGTRSIVLLYHGPRGLKLNDLEFIFKIEIYIV